MMPASDENWIRTRHIKKHELKFTAECCCNVGEVGDATAGDENLSLGMLRRRRHKIQDCLSVLVGLLL